MLITTKAMLPIRRRWEDKMAIYKIENKSLAPIQSTSFEVEGILERRDLQQMLRENIDVISPKTLVIAEEFSDWEETKSRLDLLGVDENANLVVIELKRTETGNYMELQAVRYAAMLSTLTFDKTVQIYEEFLRKTQQTKNARQELLSFLKWPDPREDEFACNIRIVLAAADFSPEVATSVLWLNEQGLDVRCVRLKPYRNGTQILLDVQQIIPLPEASDYQVKLRVQVEQRREARQKDLTKYNFNGEVYGKSRLVLAVVKAYLQDKPKTTFEGLKAAFPDSNQGSWGVIALQERGQEVFNRSGYYRYFIDDSDVLRTADQKAIVVCNEWGVGNIGKFIERARELGFQIT
jgi:Endonuclease NucS